MRDSGQKVARKRVALLATILLVWVLVVVGRLIQLQVFESQDYTLYAESQQTRNVQLLAPRGTIYDRNGNPLALSLEHDSIAINPLRVPDPADAARRLARVFHLDRAKLEAKIRRYQENRWGFLWIRRWSTEEESKAARALRADWIEFYRENKRYYPKRQLASHVLGSVGVDGNGLFGLEYKLEEILGGIPGEANVLQDVRMRGIESRVTKEPEPGTSIRITIDQRIQSAAETALRKAIRENHVPTGSVMVMDPYTGDILAMASYPDFDPNVRPRRQSDLEKRINRGMSLIHEPGSVFKVVTLAAALEKTRIRPDTIIDCGNGSYRLPGRVVHDHHSYDALSMSMVLAKSSNIGAINIANSVGKDTMEDYVRAFGFGERTGVELPFEEPGYVWPMKTVEKPRIYSNILASVAMGHQISVTTLQLGQACSVIANGGTLVRPRILIETRSPKGKVEAKPTRRGGRVIRPENAITMRRMMESVVLEGTGKSARLAGWTAGGKTGTAQIFDLEQKRYLHEYHSSFMGFAPLRNPAVVVVVTLDRTRQYGGAIAAPVFQEVTAETLRILGIPMDNPATAMAKGEKPKPEDLEEGDAGLVEMGLAVETEKLLPDTRRQILRMLQNAIKVNPEIEEWMLTPSGPESEGEGNRIMAARTRSSSMSEELLRAKQQFDADTQPAHRNGSAVGGLNEDRPVQEKPVRFFVELQEVPDLTGKPIRDVMTQALSGGLDVQVYGRGIARTQIPPAGSKVPKGQAIRVLFTP